MTPKGETGPADENSVTEGQGQEEAAAPREMRLIQSMTDLPAQDWDACANPDPERFNPFLAHDFLRALEESGSASADEGWAPCHLVHDSGGTVEGVMPLYLKGHSYGEYVFDHGWANAYSRAGGRYYPKLQCAVPFTPATGPRLLARPGPGQSEARKALVAGAIAAAKKLQVSSLHITFPHKEDWDLMGEMNLLQRTDQQFHWENRDYDSFDGFLADLASRKRKNLRKEREAALESGIEIEWVTGADLTEAHWDAFFQFYVDTGARKWGQPYLTRSFFSLVSEAMAEHILLIMCKREGRYIAGALNFIGGETLFGRHWGCIEDHRFLHFEACYYQAIDFAIDRGLKRVEAGAQGSHKIARGYVPAPTYSAHWIADPGFRDAVARYLEAERDAVAEDMEALQEYSPFRKTGPDGQSKDGDT